MGEPDHLLSSLVSPDGEQKLPLLLVRCNSHVSFSWVSRDSLDQLGKSWWKGSFGHRHPVWHSLNSEAGGGAGRAGVGMSLKGRGTRPTGIWKGQLCCLGQSQELRPEASGESEWAWAPQVQGDPEAVPGPNVHQATQTAQAPAGFKTKNKVSQK